MTALAYLFRLCRRWGGEITFVSEDEFSNLSRVHGIAVHPLGHHAIHVAHRRVIADRHRANPGTIIHEMGHVFLEEGRPSTAYEPDWLGWEIVLARRARCLRAWMKQNAGYELCLEDHFGSWGDMDYSTERRVIADRIAYAKKIGIVSQDGEPLCTRKQR